MNLAAASRPVEEREFVAHDGESLFYRHWPAATETPKGAILLFHRGHEHSGRMAHLVEELALPDYAFFAWDARGHGRSPGPRGYSPGVAASVGDVQAFAEHVAQAHGRRIEDMAVVAQSVGAVVAASWILDHAPPIRAFVAASPAFKVKLYAPFARPGLKLLKKLRGDFYVNSYVRAEFLTHDPERIASFKADPLIARAISVNMLLELYEAGERVVAEAGKIATPVQLLISGGDWVVHRAPQERFFANLGSAVKERKLLPGFYHDTLGEKDRAPAIADVRAFVEGRFAA